MSDTSINDYYPQQDTPPPSLVAGEAPEVPVAPAEERHSNNEAGPVQEALILKAVWAVQLKQILGPHTIIISQ